MSKNTRVAQIINVGPSSGRFAPAGFGAYATSKARANTTIGVLANGYGGNLREIGQPTRTTPCDRNGLGRVTL